MRFVHTADIHWGMRPDSNKPWSAERYQDIKTTFEEIISYTKAYKADCLFISGDLFHRQPLNTDLKELDFLFSTIPNTRVVIIAGNHDRVRKSSALLSFHWSSNVTFFLDSDISSVYFEDINTEVWGLSYHTAEITSNLLEDVSAPDNGHIQVLMAHGGDSEHLPFNREKLSASGFSYIALGHIHKPEVLVRNKMAYCGSPEPLDKTESGSHGIYSGEIDDSTHEITSLDFIPMARASYVPLIVNVTENTTNTELSMRINQEIEKRGTRNIYRFRIRGMRNPDVSFEFEALESKWRIVEILDESEPQYNYNELFSKHPGDMIGFYIQALQKDDMSPVEKKALNYGIHAFLHTMDERSILK